MTTPFQDTYCQFIDYLAPMLDAYEHAIYAYILRHTTLIGAEEAVIGFKSARTKMSLGAGQQGSPMSENTCRKKLDSLEEKGVILKVRTEHSGTRIRVVPLGEIPGLTLNLDQGVESVVSLEDMDFFETQENRQLIFEREGRRCFYTLEELNESNFVIDHVVSRPDGNNGYRNVVACSREANNRKGAMDADKFLFRLHRDGVLSLEELGKRLTALDKLKAGDLKPYMRQGADPSSESQATTVDERQHQ